MNYELFKRSHVKHIHFLFCQEAPIAATDILLGQASKVDAIELDDLIAEVLEDATHDAIATTMNLDADLLAVSLACVIDSICMNLSVFKFDACCNLMNVSSRNVLVEPNVINLLLEELRMRQLGSQLAIIREKEHASRVSVETTYRIDAFATSALHKVHNGLAILRVVACGHIILGLVQEDINLLLYANKLVVEVNLV